MQSRFLELGKTLPRTSRLYCNHAPSVHALIPGGFRRLFGGKNSSNNLSTGGGIVPGGGSGGRGGGSLRVASGGAGGEGPGGGGAQGLWAKYLGLLESSPMLTRAVTCGVLNGLGDVFSQLCVEQQAFDAKRCMSFTLMGLFLVGPILALWYGKLGSLVTAPGLKGTLLSLLLDQGVFAPSFIAAFMSAITAAEGKSDQIVRKLQQDWPETIKVNWVLWIPAQFINFKFVPPNLRVLAVNITALVWNVYMSYQSHKVVVDKK